MLARITSKLTFASITELAPCRPFVSPQTCLFWPLLTPVTQPQSKVTFSWTRCRSINLSLVLWTWTSLCRQTPGNGTPTSTFRPILRFRSSLAQLSLTKSWKSSVVRPLQLIWLCSIRLIPKEILSNLHQLWVMHLEFTIWFCVEPTPKEPTLRLSMKHSLWLFSSVTQPSLTSMCKVHLSTRAFITSRLAKLTMLRVRLANIDKSPLADMTCSTDSYTWT